MVEWSTGPTLTPPHASAQRAGDPGRPELLVAKPPNPAATAADAAPDTLQRLDLGALAQGGDPHEDRPRRGRRAMRLANRLLLVLGAAIALVMLGYGTHTLQRHRTLLDEAVERETAMLVGALRSAALQPRGAGEPGLSDLLDELARDPETYAALLLDADGVVVAGSASDDGACLQPAVSAWRSAPGEAAGWARCGARVNWALVRLPVSNDGVLLARRASRVEREMRAELRRLLLLALALGGVATLGVLVVLRRTLHEPLERIVQAVRVLGHPRRQPVRVSRAAGELHGLADAVNRIGDHLDARRMALLQETEERIAVENRLHAAETFAVAGRLTGSLIHEIGSPLAVIAMHADAIANRPGATPETQAQIDEIQAELERIAELVDGLRRIVRRTSLPLLEIDVAEVVRAALNDIHARCHAARVEVAARIPPWPVKIHGHRTLLRHAVFNLLNNAVQALSTTPGERRLWVAVERLEEDVRIVIEDSGPGLTTEQLRRLFDPFFTTKPDEGSGLGLVISRSIAEEHGGRLSITPRAQGGVRAVLDLPIHPQRPASGD